MALPSMPTLEGQGAGRLARSHMNHGTLVIKVVDGELWWQEVGIDTSWRLARKTYQQQWASEREHRKALMINP